MVARLSNTLPFLALVVWSFVAGMLFLQHTGWSVPAISVGKIDMAQVDPVQGVAMFLLVLGVNRTISKSNARYESQ